MLEERRRKKTKKKKKKKKKKKRKRRTRRKLLASHPTRPAECRHEERKKWVVDGGRAMSTTMRRAGWTHSA